VIGVLQLSFIPGLTRRGMWRGQIEGVRSAYANRPLEIDARLSTVMEAIKRFADKTKLLEH